MAVTSTFQKIHDKAERAGITRNSEQSRAWFMQNLKNIRNLSRKAILSDDLTLPKNRPLPGRVFQFFYDPKGKETLPYYDEFPLIIMVEPAPNGFYGLNLHYLSPRLRALFFDEIMVRMKEGKRDELTRLQLTYDFLKSSRKMRLFQPCFKRYLFSQVKSRVIQIMPSEWELAMFLPSSSFQGATNEEVWRDSRKYR